MFLWCLDVGAWSFSFRASSRRLLQNDRGRDKGLNLAPPSEPDGRISRLRLSSRWVLCREGAALRLVPQCGGLSFGVPQANGTWRTPPLASPRGHSRWFFFPVFRIAALPPSCVPSLHGHSSLQRYYGRSDSRQPGTRTVCPSHPPALAGLPDYCVGTAHHADSNHRGSDRRSSGCQRVLPAATGFVTRSKTRPLTPTESSSRQTASWPPSVPDWSFSFRCAPPRLAVTQLRSDTARFFTAQKPTSTALSQRLLRRTSAAL